MSCQTNFPIQQIVDAVIATIDIEALGGVSDAELTQRVLLLTQSKLDELRQFVVNSGAEKFMVDHDLEGTVLTTILNTGEKVTIDLAPLVDGGSISRVTKGFVRVRGSDGFVVAKSNNIGNVTREATGNYVIDFTLDGVTSTNSVISIAGLNNTANATIRTSMISLTQIRVMINSVSPVAAADGDFSIVLYSSDF